MTVTIHPLVSKNAYDDNGVDDGEVYQPPLFEFESQAAPFGIEWTEPVSAQVVVPDGSSFLCGEVPATMESASFQAQHEYPLAYLVEEGECSWEEKSLNVNDLGGEYMILYSRSGTLGLPSGHPSVTQTLWRYAPEIDPPIGALGITRDSGLAIRDKVLQARSASTTTTNGTVVVVLATLQEDYSNAFGNPLNVTSHVTAMQVSAVLSFLGSAWIVSRLFQTKKRRQAKTPTLFLLFLSLGDCISSLCLFVGPWAIPEVPAKFGQMSTEIWYTYFPLASGTDATCAAQGFFYQFSAWATGFCTAFLALQNLLIVKHNWTNERIHKLERVSLTGGFLLAFGMAIACAAMDVLNPIPYGFCWIAQYPMMCESPQLEEAGRKGILGAWCAEDSTSTNDNLARFFFALIWMSSFFVAICVCMGLIFCYVRKQEQVVERWSENAREGRAQRHVLWKAMCYLGAFLMVNGVGSLAMFVGEPWLKFLMALVFPLQGLFNALIYSNVLDRLFGCQPRREVSSTPASSTHAHGRSSSNVPLSTNEASVEISPHSLAWYRKLRQGVSTMVSARSLDAGNHNDADTSAAAAAEERAKKEEEEKKKAHKKEKKRKSKSKKKKKKAENKLKAEFKLWKSLPSTFETWTSEATPDEDGRKRKGFRLWSAPPSDYETWRSGVEPLDPTQNPSATTMTTVQMEAMEEGSKTGAIKAADVSQTGNSLDTDTAVRAAEEQLGQEEPSSDGEVEDDEDDDDDGLAHLAALARGLSIPHCIEDDSLHFSDPSESEQQADPCCVTDKPNASDSGESTQEGNGDSKVGEGPCTSCGKTIQTSWKFCPHCGNSRDCSSCGKPLQPEWTFCPHCGKGRDGTMTGPQTDVARGA